MNIAYSRFRRVFIQFKGRKVDRICLFGETRSQSISRGIFGSIWKRNL